MAHFPSFELNFALSGTHLDLILNRLAITLQDTDAHPVVLGKVVL